ncbi:cell division control protein 48-like protein B [Cucumis melo var. makuwa]|uniref:Cell division control protein 48-like protein B n=1 Tax=Cucumis melo var. makuwa TaxID=1194695 RepID=A0A5D3CCH6_CUCMM|nr:cell division control protein 48-like protein B [Cucumis melo var. makuwa]TYK09030.1 cell division control protein 48-like protein B [Cucumis melo var. makuwa]
MEDQSSVSGNCGNGSENKWRAEEAIAGNSEALKALRELIVFPLLFSQEAKKIGLKWPRGLLLYGPPGTGKTSLVRAIVQESGAHLTTISPHSVHRAHAGESEKVLREAFTKASSLAISGKPSVIFIDEIDALCPPRDSRREQNVRITTQLSILMDSNKQSASGRPHVVVVASTNRVDAVDPALRRSGRFDAEIEVTAPTEDERYQILRLYTRKVQLNPEVDLRAIAASCNGFVGADLEALCREAAMAALQRCSGTNENAILCMTTEDWKHARSIVGPSMTRGITVEVPNVTWDDIGGLKDLKKKLQQSVEWPIKHAASFSKLGISPARGILLYGPPGCSKTTLAKAAANAAQASFFSLSGAEMYSMYVGEGEALLRNTFRRARLAAPSIIFFDEADVVAAKRLVPSTVHLFSNFLLSRVSILQGILVLAATNRPHAIDAALMRPGRFDLVLYVPPPDLDARYEILRVHTRPMTIGSDVDLKKIAEDTELFTGAELEGLCREAGMVALREDITASVVCGRHFQTVKDALKPALTLEDIAVYSTFMKTRSALPSQHADLSSKNKIKSERNLFGPVSLVKLGLVGCFFLVLAKYFLSKEHQVEHELMTT